MWEQTQLIIQTIQLAAVLAILVLRSITFAEYFRLKRRTTRVISLLRTKMDCDDLIDQLLEDAPAGADASRRRQIQRRCPSRCPRGKNKKGPDWRQSWLAALPKNI